MSDKIFSLEQRIMNCWNVVEIATYVLEKNGKFTLKDLDNE